MSIWADIIVYMVALLLVLATLALNDIAFVQLGSRKVQPSQPSFLRLSWDSTRQVFLLVLLPFTIVVYGQVVRMTGMHIEVALSSFFVMVGGFEPTIYFLISGLTGLEKPEKQDRVLKFDAIPEGYIMIPWWQARSLTVLAFALTCPFVYLGLRNAIGIEYLSLSCSVSFFGVGSLLSNLRRHLNKAAVVLLVVATGTGLVYTLWRFLAELVTGT